MIFDFLLICRKVCVRIIKICIISTDAQYFQLDFKNKSFRQAYLAQGVKLY